MYYQNINFNLFFEKAYIFAGDVLHYSPSWSFLVLVAFLLLIKEIKKVLQEFDLFQYGDKKLFRNSQKRMPEQLKDIKNQLFKDERKTADLLPTIKSEIEIIKNIDHPAEPEKTEQMILAIASLRFQLWCEKFNSDIFASQINLLRRLEMDEEGLSFDDANSYFEELKKTFKVFREWNFEMYMHYLLQGNVITVNGSRYRITILGKDFLSWLILSGNINKVKSL